MQNTTGYMMGRNYEMEGITKDGAKMLMAQAGSEVPKFTVITSAAFGAGYYGMCGRAWDPRMLWAWPNVHMGVMGPDQAANTLMEVKANQMKRAGSFDQAELDQLWETTRAAYQEQLSACLLPPRADLGQRDDRPGGHAQCAWHFHFGSPECATGPARLWRVPVLGRT